MADKLNIKLNIAGKPYPLSIERSDEEKYRRAERDVNMLVSTYKKHFRAEAEDYLAMAALQLAVNNIDSEMNRGLGEAEGELIDLDRQLDEYLGNLKP
ncbi:MAG: cell division protein ZapA [Rikenellaceae bacterium]|nr:cell division protein ZapA [Rikenellaceae bacterium]